MKRFRVRRPTSSDDMLAMDDVRDRPGLDDRTAVIVAGDDDGSCIAASTLVVTVRWGRKAWCVHSTRI